MLPRSRRIQTDVENRKMRNIELTSEAREKDARVTVESAKLMTVEGELASVKMNLAASCVEGAMF